MSENNENFLLANVESCLSSTLENTSMFPKRRDNVTKLPFFPNPNFISSKVINFCDNKFFKEK